MFEDFESNLCMSEQLDIEGSVYRGYAAYINSKDEAFLFISKPITSTNMGLTSFEHFHSAYSIQNTVIDTHKDKGSSNI